MDVKKLKWCYNQNKGLKIIKPNENLAKEYIESAEETLMILQEIGDKSNMWLSTTKYYCEYFSIYALLMKFGVKSEIHDCTIELSKFLENKNLIPKGFTKVLERDKELRIDNQYYLKNRKVELDFEELRDFVLTIKNKINSITTEEIAQIRKDLDNLIKF